MFSFSNGWFSGSMFVFWGVQLCVPCHLGNSHSCKWATKKKGRTYMKYRLVNRDPHNGLLWSLYSWVVKSTIWPNQPGFVFNCSSKKTTSTYPNILGFLDQRLEMVAHDTCMYSWSWRWNMKISTFRIEIIYLRNLTVWILCSIYPVWYVASWELVERIAVRCLLPKEIAFILLMEEIPNNDLGCKTPVNNGINYTYLSTG